MKQVIKINWGLFMRIIAATLLNYVLTSLLTGLTARLLPSSALEASTAATLSSFLIFAVIAMLAFSVQSVRKLWIGMMLSSLLASALLWSLIQAGGRL